LSPALLFVVVFIAFPLGSEVWFSLSNAQVGEIGSFVGLSNFVYLVQQSTYYDALVNTFVYAVVGIGAKAILATSSYPSQCRPWLRSGCSPWRWSSTTM